MVDLEIKLASIEDLPAIEKVEAGLFDYAVKPERAREFLNDARHHLVLASHKHRIVGMASAIHYVHPDKDPALFITEVGVLEAYRNHGIGRTLVRKMWAHGRSLGCHEIWMATEHSNIPARKAYVAAGGVEDKEPVVLITFPESPE